MPVNGLVIRAEMLASNAALTLPIKKKIYQKRWSFAVCVWKMLSVEGAHALIMFKNSKTPNVNALGVFI